MPDHAVWTALACEKCGTFARGCTDCRRCAGCHEPPEGRPEPGEVTNLEPVGATVKPKGRKRGFGAGTL